MRLETLNRIREILAEREIEASAEMDAAARELHQMFGSTDEAGLRVLHVNADKAAEEWREIHAALDAFDSADWHC